MRMRSSPTARTSSENTFRLRGSAKLFILMKKYSYPEAQSLVICGDIHGDFEALVYDACVRYKLADTVVIVAGDCGFGFNRIKYYEALYNRLAGRLRKANNWVVFIRGNHDAPAYFSEERINYRRFRCIPDYSVVEAAGHNVLCVGGATSIDRLDRIRLDEGSRKEECAHYWKDEAPVFSQELINSLDCRIDTVVTHTAPSFCYPNEKCSISSWLRRDPELAADLDAERETMDMLYRSLSGHPVQRWYYGHFHESKSEKIDGVHFRLLDCSEMAEVRMPAIV